MDNMRRSLPDPDPAEMAERLAERSNQLLSARDRIDTLTDEVEYLDQQLRGAVERIEQLKRDLDHEAREHQVTHERWMAAKAELDRLGGR